jgi:putative ABC transport system permease protein
MSGKRLHLLTPLQRENLDVALKSVSGNRLRSLLTIAIIAIGIMSLVGIQTAVQALTSQVSDSFSRMGASSFSISQDWERSGSHHRVRNAVAIKYDDASRFKSLYDTSAIVSISATALQLATIKSGSAQTEPRVSVIAGDENFFTANKYTLADGRGLDRNDIDKSAFVAVIGKSVSTALFKKDSPVGKEINVNGRKYSVIGEAASVGAAFGGGFDNTVLIPVSNGRSNFLGEGSSFKIEILPPVGKSVETASGEAQVLFRSVRRLSPQDPDDFRIDTSVEMLQELGKMKHSLMIASLIIGLITILGAAVGLMNIMLVSVKERTREIGLRKTLGATAQTIKRQFLMESVVIGQIGGLAGIILGVLAGDATAAIIKVKPVIPWVWMLIAVVICFLVSIFSGYVPASRAAKLDPIESLRYE